MHYQIAGAELFQHHARDVCFGAELHRFRINRRNELRHQETDLTNRARGCTTSAGCTSSLAHFHEVRLGAVADTDTASDQRLE